MGGVKGRSGPPGNLNSARSGAASYWRRRALRPVDRWVLPLTAKYGAEIVEQKGGRENIAPTVLRQIELAQAARTAWLLALADEPPNWERGGVYMGLEFKILKALGGERFVKTVTLQDILEARVSSDDQTLSNGDTATEPDSAENVSQRGERGEGQ